MTGQQINALKPAFPSNNLDNTPSLTPEEVVHMPELCWICAGNTPFQLRFGCGRALLSRCVGALQIGLSGSDLVEASGGGALANSEVSVGRLRCWNLRPGQSLRTEREC